MSLKVIITFKTIVVQQPNIIFNHRRLSFGATKFSKSSILKILGEMSRPIDKHIIDAQKQRQVLKERVNRYVPSAVTLQVLGSGAKGAPKSVYVFTDQSRYLFNCGEGTQRLAHEHKMKLARLEHIFMTSVNWRNMGGLPGVALTLQDIGVPKITLHGPPGLDELFTATKKFIIMKDMKIEMDPCDPENPYEDNVMTLKYVPLIRQCTQKEMDDSCEASSLQSGDNSVATDGHNKTKDHYYSPKEDIEPDNTDYYAHETSGRRDLQNTKIDDLFHAPRKEQLTTMAYICKLKPLSGTLDLQKCVDKGVKPGPVLGLLKNGQDITLPDGTVVYANDVTTRGDPGQVFIIIDIPNLLFLDSLATSQDFFPYQEKTLTNVDYQPAIIVHFTPSDVIKDERYQSFIKSFSKDTCHLLINDENLCSGSIAVHRTQRKLNLLHKNIFPIMKESEDPIRINQPDLKTKQAIIDQMKEIEKKVAMVGFEQSLDFFGKPEADLEKNGDATGLVNGKTFTAFHLRPRKGLDHTTELKLDVFEYIREAMDAEGFSESLQQLYETISNLKFDKSQEYPKIVFFGTGSCIPNKTRNTSGLMVHIDKNQSILMDCGEGTYGQMVRFYGKEQVDSVLKNLKAIYLSHLHADHHLGLIGVLQERRRVLNKCSENNDQPLYLIAPKQIMSWLSMYDRRFEKILDEFELIPNCSLVKSHENSYKIPSDNILKYIGLSNIETCRVRHCPSSFGVTITTNSQSKKITYSGDTMPCKELIDIGMNSDVLIHEATMEDDLLVEAKRKMHSTSSQAVRVGEAMKAKFTLLTHFSQRYARVPRLSPTLENSPSLNVGISFDNMQVTLDELCILPHLYPTLKLMFADHCEELEHKAAKRAKKREWCRSSNMQAGYSRSFSSDSTSREPKSSFMGTADSVADETTKIKNYPTIEKLVNNDVRMKENDQ